MLRFRIKKIFGGEILNRGICQMWLHLQAKCPDCIFCHSGSIPDGVQQPFWHNKNHPYHLRSGSWPSLLIFYIQTVPCRDYNQPWTSLVNCQFDYKYYFWNSRIYPKLWVLLLLASLPLKIYYIYMYSALKWNDRFLTEANFDSPINVTPFSKLEIVLKPFHCVYFSIYVDTRVILL